MGCFLGCFGISSKRKRRKPANRVLPGDPRHGSYEPLESSVSNSFDIREKNPISSDSELSSKVKEKSIASIKVRKKVSFNLNVQTYELLSKDQTGYHSDEEEEREKNGADAAKASVSAVSGSDTSMSKMSSFPSNYRYHNCIDSYDEEDDMENIESDLEYDEEEDEEDDSGNEFDDEISRSEFLEQLNSQSMAENKSNNHMQLPASTDSELKPVESIRNARDRSQYVSPVLNPVENLTQWKAIKARTAPTKHMRKENVALEQEPSVPLSLKPSSNLYPFNLESKYNQSEPLLQEIAVNASLSNWLASPISNKSKATSITSGRSTYTEIIPSKKSIFDRSCSQQSREQRPIPDITNLEA
ncbi:hypothetical protein JRO89_XS03G0084300 [Xanthoceras sorbifolium]|uniref:Uncharacterized protein n=1 Tax=Xanthoceras sorbifolium TaxID=99658 RepID=A0ABQ8I962_9ROSI|nr:hypothetical protein JRO89_XS03G0084300 [Xanthoceras sorbifolium]